MKRLTSMFVALCFILSVVGYAYEKPIEEPEEAYFVGEEDDVTFPLNEMSSDLVITAEDISCIESTANSNIITTSDMLCDNFQNEFRTAFEQDNRILITGDISEEEVREYFNLPVADHTRSDISNAKEGGIEGNQSPAVEYEEAVERVNISEFAILGHLVYQDQVGTNVTSIYVSDTTNSELIADTISYCFSYDYLGLSDRATTNDYENSWINLDISSDTYSHERAIITTSLAIEKNAGNPNSDGEYLFYIPYRVDVSPIEPYAISYVDLDVHGADDSLVYDYGPANTSCSANASISFQLPYAISVSFSPGTSVDVERIDGGLDSNNFTVRYQPKNFLGFDTYTHDDMQCEAHIEGYQDGYFYQAFGSFEVEIYRAQQPSGGAPGYTDPILLYNDRADYAGGIFSD